MSQYIASLRLSKPRSGFGTSPGTQPLTNYTSLAKALMQQPGVGRASYDQPTATMIVAIDRSLVTIADLVRLIEETGVSVGSVAQSKASIAAGVAEAVGA